MQQYIVWVFLFVEKALVVKKLLNLYGPCAGALDAESPKSKNNEIKFLGREISVFPYGLAPYSACAKVYQFPTIPAYSQAPWAFQTT